MATSKKKVVVKKAAPAKTKAKVKAKAEVKAKTKASPKKAVGKKAVAKPANKKAPVKKTNVKPVAKKPVKKTATKPVKANTVKKQQKVIKKTPMKKDTLSTDTNDFIPYQPKKNEEYMNDPQKEHFKSILRNWRNELMEEVDRTVHHMQDEASNPPDPADRATLEEEFSIELRTRDRERRLIKKIDSTLELIAVDEYGYCDSCGVEIGIRRLEARPTASKCIDCKTLDEIKEKQLGA